MYSVHISDQFLRYACSSECEDEQQSRFPLSHCSIANCEHFRSRAIFLMTVRNICEHDFLSELSETVLDSISKSIDESLFATYFWTRITQNPHMDNFQTHK